MSTPQELEQKFWKALRSDMTVMLGLIDAEHLRRMTRPMTAQLDGDARARPDLVLHRARHRASARRSAQGQGRASIAFPQERTTSSPRSTASVRDRQRPRRHRAPVEPVRCGLVRKGQGRSETCAAPLRSGRRASLAEAAPACSPASRCCSAAIRKRTIETRWLRSRSRPAPRRTILAGRRSHGAAAVRRATCRAAARP